MAIQMFQIILYSRADVNKVSCNLTFKELHLVIVEAPNQGHYGSSNLKVLIVVFMENPGTLCFVP